MRYHHSKKQKSIFLNFSILCLFLVITRSLIENSFMSWNLDQFLLISSLLVIKFKSKEILSVKRSMDIYLNYFLMLKKVIKLNSNVTDNKIFKYNLISYFKILKNVKIINDDFKNIEKTYLNTVAIYKIRNCFFDTRNDFIFDKNGKIISQTLDNKVRIKSFKKLILKIRLNLTKKKLF